MDHTGPHPEPERRGARQRSASDAALNPLYSLLRWIGAHVRGFYTAVGVYLTLALGVMLLSVVAFSLLAAVTMRGVTQRFDNSVLLWLNQHASPKLDAAALEITALGSGYVIWMMVLIASILLWNTRHHYSVALLWVAMLGSGVLNSTLKNLFDRPRPNLFEWRTPHAGLSSFPSGHAMTAMVLYATLAYLVVRLETARMLRRLTLLIFALVVALVGISRMYLGVHYPSDVLAGFVVGFFWATLCALGMEAVRYFRGRKPDVEEEEEGVELGMDPVRDAVETHPDEPAPDRRDHARGA